MNEEIAINPKAEIGKAILDRARQEYDEGRKRLVVKQAGDILRGLSECEQTIQHGQKVKDFLLAKMAALEAGEFDLNGRTASIEFHNKDLNESVPK
jgi:hypothetical protein